jgi:hypothetical protein
MLFVGQEAVIPILYRHLIVSSPDQVHKLAVTVAMAHPLNSHVSKYTRAIEICDDISLELDSPHYSSHMVPHNSICMVECSTPAITNNLLAVLMQTMNLRKVVIAGLLGPSAMAVISRITALTITCLTLNITDYMALRGMVYIADFTHLQTLQIESILKEERISNELPIMLRPWLMPHLYTLTVSASQSWSLPLVTMLHQSQLPNLRKFHYSVSTSDPRTIELLAVLFKHLPDLQEASLKLDPQVQNYETLLPFIRASSLEISPINTAALDYLSPYTNELRIHASVASVRPADLWSLFEELLHRNGNIRTVHLNQYEFLWKVEPDEDGDIPCGMHALPYLLNYALRLSQLRIELKDAHGKTLRDYMG